MSGAAGSRRRRHALRCAPMDVPAGFSPTLILVLNLAGTFVFGLSGGVAGGRGELDPFGGGVVAGGGGGGGGGTQGGPVRPPPPALPGLGRPGAPPPGGG